MPRNKYPDITEEKILNVSLKLFFERGYEQTTIQEIAANLDGLTRGAIYHHFKSKEDILEALSEKMFYRDNPFLLLEREDEYLTGLEKLRKLILLPISEERYKVMLWEIPLVKNPRFLAKLLETNQMVLKPKLKEIIDQGIQDGSLDIKNSDMIAELVLLLTNFWLIPSLFPCDSEGLKDRIQVIKNIMDVIGLPIIRDEELELIFKKTDFVNR